MRVATFAEDVVTGLGVRPYTLLPKYFYDDLGSALFEAITRLPEYYLTRIERDLLATYSSQIVASFDEPLELVPDILGDPNVGIRHAINGLLSLTPDGLPLLGETAEIKGLWSVAAVWIKEAPGIARCVAEWMTSGVSRS